MVYWGCGRLGRGVVWSVRTMASCVWGLGEGVRREYTYRGIERARGRACPRLPAWRLEPLEGTHLSRNRRKDGLDGNSSLVGHSADGVAALKRRDSNHGKTRKGRPVLGLKHAVVHLAKSWWFRSNMMVVWKGIMVLSNHGTFPVWGSRNSVCYRTGTPTLAAGTVYKTQKTKVF